MMRALDTAGFHVRLRWTITYEESIQIRRLDQVFFVSNAQVIKAQRFCSEFMIQLDATFNTNALKLPLVNIVGVDNHNKTFTVALSFVRAEAATDFLFILDCLDELVFFGSAVRPKVLISDQAAGLFAAVSTHPTWKTIFHQLCQWHMFGNIQSFIQKHRRIKTTAELDKVFKTVWAVIQCWNEEDLETKRQEMYMLFDGEEIEYYRSNWMQNEKEKRVITAHVRMHANLGLNSSSRAEGQHPVIKRFLNHQMSLDEAAKALIRNISMQDIHDSTRNAHSQIERHQPSVLGISGLRHLETVLTSTAINLMKKEMHEAQVRALNGPPQHNPDCCPSTCQNPLRYSLPCRHLMHQFAYRKEPLPYILIHPRWFINPTNAYISLSTAVQTPESIPPAHYLQGAGEIHLAGQAMAAEVFRSQLPPDQAEQYVLRIGAVVSSVQEEFNPDQQLVAVFPTPPPLSKRAEELKRKSHKKASIRLPTAAERAEIDVRKRKRAETMFILPELDLIPPSTTSAHSDTNKNTTTVRPQPKKSRQMPEKDTPVVDLTQTSVAQAAVNWEETQDTDHWEALYMNGISLEGKRHTAGNSQEFPIDLCNIESQNQRLIDSYCGRVREPQDKNEGAGSGGSSGYVEREDVEREDVEESQLSWHYELDL
jgi:predicted DNA-binding protein YlxM (UPF0122 family)